MRSLLKSKELRQLQIVEYLLETDGWTTNSELAVMFNCSTRIIKADLSELRKLMTELQFDAGYLGIRLTKESDFGVQAVYSKLLSETLVFQILEEIFSDETLSIEDLAEKFYVSHSTVYRTITQINDYSRDSLQCYVETNPCRLIGNEQNIRLFYRTYFAEKNTLLGWPFRGINEKEINHNFDKILSFMVTDMPIDFAYYEDINLVVLVNKIRYDHHHLIDTSDGEIELLNVFLKIYKYIVQPLGLVSSMQINKESFYQVFSPYIRKNLPRNIKQLRKAKKQLNCHGEALRFLEESLLDLSDKWQLPLNVDFVLFVVHGTAVNDKDLLNSDLIFFDRYKYFAMKFKSNFPELYQAIHIIIHNFCVKLSIATEDLVINYLLFTLVTYWDGLISNYIHKKKQVSVVILSDRHYTHSNMIKDFLELELPRKVAIDVYSKIKISDSIIENLNYDIIVSNFMISTTTTKKVVVSHDFPTSIDLDNIKSAISSVLIDRNNDHLRSISAL